MQNRLLRKNAGYRRFVISENMTHGVEMDGHVVRHALDRARVDPGEVDDVILECALPEGATGANVSRQAAIRAGCPVSVPNLQSAICGSLFLLIV
jgi:acetyl-CoA acetyltransferase